MLERDQWYPGDRKYIPYHSTEWNRLANQGWVTMEVLPLTVRLEGMEYKLARMIYNPELRKPINETYQDQR